MQTQCGDLTQALPPTMGMEWFACQTPLWTLHRLKTGRLGSVPGPVRDLQDPSVDAERCVFTPRDVR